MIFNIKYIPLNTDAPFVRFNAIYTKLGILNLHAPALHTGRWINSDFIGEIRSRIYFGLQSWTSLQPFQTLPLIQEATHILIPGFLYPLQDVSGEIITSYASGGFWRAERNAHRVRQSDTKVAMQLYTKREQRATETAGTNVDYVLKKNNM